MADGTGDDNARTIAAYQDGAARWLADRRTDGPWSEVVDLIDEFVTLVPRGASVLEIGSAAGVEADAMSSRGLVVRRSDATPAFVAGLRAAGHDARQLNVVVDDLDGPWDVIFANAVFLHLGRDQFADVLRRTFEATGPRGLLVFTLKEGTGSAWVTKKLNLARHFTYWDQAELVEFIGASPWSLASLRHVDGAADQWLFCICDKS